MTTILDNFKDADLRLDPYPYVIIKDALPSEYYRELSSSRPHWEVILDGRQNTGNLRYDLNAVDILSSPLISNCWKQFTINHTSDYFYHKILDIFELAIYDLYSDVLKKSYYDYSTGVRGGDKAKVLMDCSLGINTPSNTVGSVRGPHIDNPRQLWGGMLYMRQPTDLAGGNIQVCRANGMPQFYGKAECFPDNIEVVETLPYGENTAIVFINSILSIHAVSARGPTSQPRELVNIIGEVDFPLFSFEHLRVQKRINRSSHQPGVEWA